jgi:hypothetical protein
MSAQIESSRNPLIAGVFGHFVPDFLEMPSDLRSMRKRKNIFGKRPRRRFKNLIMPRLPSTGNLDIKAKNREMVVKPGPGSRRFAPNLFR